jgi:phosphate transport system substrate-binding protein
MLLVLSRFLERKRLSFREGYNSKIALVPDLAVRNPAIEPFLATFENVSSLIVKIRNMGRSTIAEEDYLEPLSFTFENRFILDFRVSEPRPVEIRDKIDDEAYVSRTIDDFGNPPRSTCDQQTLREDLSRLLTSTPDSDPFTNEEKDARRQLTIPKLTLKPKDEFKIAIDLREYTLSPGLKSTDKRYDCRGKLRSGKIIDQSVRRRRASLTQIAAALFLLLLGGLIVTIFILIFSVKERYCGEGELRVVGSSAFAPVAQEVSSAYMKACTGASVSVEPNGSLEGLRQVLAADPSSRSQLAALSDGQATGDIGPLVPKQVAILVYSIIVNKEVKIDNLSLEQVRGIYQGRYTNWRQVGSTVDLPIRIVSRGASSGSRQTFERYILRFAENILSSNFCVEKDRDSAASIIRCERDSATQVLNEVNRIPGAIGYADETQVPKYKNISRARLEGLESTAQYLPGYPFWTIEYLYTNGVPPTSSLLNGYLDYISSDAARSRIHDFGYTPCVQSDGHILDICQAPR